jgi:drug/metabolite transporter (DMT)-like permease
MTGADKSPSPVDYGLIVLLGVLLGIPYALTKISQTTIPPLTGVAVRVALAAVVLWIYVIVTKVKISALRGHGPRLFVQGCISSVIPYALIAYGQMSVNSALAAILNSTTPLFVCVLSLLWTRHETVTIGRLVGVSAGLAGVVLIAGTNSLTNFGQGTFGQIAIILATVSSAIAAIQGRRFNDIPPALAAAGALSCGAFILVPLSFVVDAPLHSSPSAASVAALLVNAIFATALRSVIYFRLLRTIGSMGTTSVSYLKPAVGVIVGYALMGEVVSWPAMIGLIAILFGVAAINQRRLSASSRLASLFVPRPARSL